MLGSYLSKKLRKKIKIKSSKDLTGAEITDHMREAYKNSMGSIIEDLDLARQIKHLNLTIQEDDGN